MTYRAIDLPVCWGFDSWATMTDARLLALASARLPGGFPIRVILRTIPLPGNPATSDCTADEARRICDAGYILLLYQHCRAHHAAVSGEQGQADGGHAAAWVKGWYSTDAHVLLDHEDVGTPGAPASQRIVCWCDAVRPSARPALYVGFDPGLSAAELYAIPNVDRYIAAPGPWDVATRGVCGKQYAQTTLLDFQIDPLHFSPDRLGGVLRGMINDAAYKGRIPPEVPPDPPTAPLADPVTDLRLEVIDADDPELP